MAQDGTRVPAWRRLGLALKNQNHAGVAVPEQQAPSSDPDRPDTHERSEVAQQQSHAPNEPAINGKSPKLGKRKHQHEPAEDDGKESKKSRIASTESDANRETTHLPSAETTLETATVTEQAPTSGNASKGDSNYRKKKKEKPAKRRRDNHSASEGGFNAPIKPRSVSALSPDASATERATLLPSTESDACAEAASTPQKPVKKSSRKDASGSPPLTDRRKCVAFTPDTKKSDGNTGQDYFKAWVAEQKGDGPVSQPPEVSNFVLHSLIADEEKTARRNGQLDKKQPKEDTASPRPADNTPTKNQGPKLATREEAVEKKAISTPAEPKSIVKSPATPSTVKGKKKDPSVYINYLTQYHDDRAAWKFNKAKQNDVVDNALNIFRIPDQYSEALVEYVAGLQGAGVIERLRERCHATAKDLDGQDSQMDDAEARKVAQEEAEQERILKERKRRKTDGDVAALAEHPYSPGFIRRLQRKRAMDLLNALSRAAPVLPAVTPSTSLNPLMDHVGPPKQMARKRKRRTDVSSDESSSDSSDEDSSDSDSEDSEDSKSDTDKRPSAKTTSSAESESESDSENEDDSSSSSSSEDDSSSDDSE